MKTLPINVSLATLLLAPLSAVTVVDSTSAPTSNVVFSNVDSSVGGASVRWRDSGGDTDEGSTFIMPAGGPLILDAITVRIGQGQNGSLNSGAPGLPLILDFYAFNPTTTTFTPLFRETGNLPATTNEGDYITFDLSGQNQTLLGGQGYGFLIGPNVEDASGTDEDRFRLVAIDSNLSNDSEEIRRDYEFGSTRAALTDLPSINGVGARDMVFYVQAVPEPGVVGLGALWLLGLLRRKR